ncbi:MAG TPA: DUF4062 domain-containing protein [Devosia sp.]|nr:DUF4062 domain-containing protein [Devosia sp.]
MAVDKRFQVFVSSTYQDLEEERREIIQALLELDCIPSGMELFPAANQDQWSLIKGVIDDCDYYLVVVGGRYGSLGPDGLSYTEMEYRHALSTGKPVIAFVHKHPENIAIQFSETNVEKKAKLDAFKELVQRKMVKFWETPSELGSVVSRSLIRLIRDFPSEGWVRGGGISSDAAREEILKLNLRVKELEKELSVTQPMVDPIVAQTLAGGNEEVTLRFDVAVRNKITRVKKEYLHEAKLTWNEMFSRVAPGLINEGSLNQIADRVSEAAVDRHEATLEEIYSDDVETFVSIAIQAMSLDVVVVQFIALGLIQKGIRKRTVNDRGAYFALTARGESAMYEIRAVRRGQEEPSTTGDSVSIVADERVLESEAAVRPKDKQ